MAGMSASEMRQQMGQPDEPGGIYPPSTYEVAPSVAYPGAYTVFSLDTVLADNQSEQQIEALSSMTGQQRSVYLSATRNTITIADPDLPRGSARYWRR